MKKRKQPAETHPARRPSRWVTWSIAAALLVLTVAVFAQVRSHDFVDLDDGLYLVENANVRSGLTSENVQWAFTTGRAANWHPVTWMSHQLDASLFGMDAGRHHLTNLAWHVLNVLMLFGLLRYVTGSIWRSAFVAALFAVHPAHVESVAWLSERKDVLSTFFWIATTWAWAIWTRRRSATWFAVALACYALGLMSKPMLITLPFTLLLLDVWPLQRQQLGWRRRVAEKAPFFVLAIVSTIVTVLVQQQGGAVSTLERVTLGDRISTAIAAYAAYLRTLVWPVDLAAFYPYVRDIPVASIALAAAALLAISGFAWVMRRHQFLAVGWLWYLGTLVPVIGLVQIGMQSRADRYTYVPYIGLFIAVVWSVAALASRYRRGPVIVATGGAAIVIGLAVLAHAQTRTWRTSEALWTHAIAVTPDNAKAHNSLGAIYGNTGRTREAEAHFKEALRLQPDKTEGLHILPNLGRSLIAQGKVAEAVPYLEHARRLKPDDAGLANEMALAYVGVDRFDAAIAAWRDAVRIDPRQEQTWFALGMALAATGRVPEARQAFTEVLRLNPGRTDAATALSRLR